MVTMDFQQKYDILTKIVEISSSTSQINDRLTQAAHFLCVKNLAPTIAFYLLQRRGKRLALRIAADSGGSLQLPAPPYSYTLPLPDDSLCQPLITSLPNPLDPATLNPHDLFRKSQPHGWSLPLTDENQAYGTMALLSSSPFDIDNNTIIFLQIVCRQITLALRSSILKNRDQQKVRRLKFLHQIGAQLNASEDLQSIFSKLPDSALTFFSQSASILHIFNSDQAPEKLIEQGFHHTGLRELVLQVSHFQGLRTRFISHPLVIEKSSSPAAEKIYHLFFKQFCAHIILPLISQGTNVGTLEFFLTDTPQSRALLPLGKEDLELLEILAVHIAATLERTRTQKQLAAATRASQIRTRQLTLSHQIKNALLAAETPEQIIRLTLGALVNNIGFSCSPAVYLEMQKEKENFWQTIFYAKAANHNLLDPDLETNFDDFKALTDQLLASSTNIPQKINEQLKTIKLANFDLAPRRFKNSLKIRKPTILKTEFASALHGKLKSLLPGKNTIVIPIFSQEQLKGVILANADLISHNDIAYVTLFTDTATLALDNIRLYQRLQSSLASLNSAQLRLSQSEKLMALGEMASSIAHEIKNPLVSIAGFARRLHKRIPDQSREKAYSQIITKEIERLEEIVNNVLSFSRPQSNKFEPNDINLMIDETVSLFARELKKLKINLDIELEPQMAAVECDINQMKQVLINLFNNSIQAMSSTANGSEHHILVRTSCFCELKRKQERALIEIEDNGKGIQEQYIHDIFNPFFTTKHDGTGLGLPICHRIILNHQGDIRIHNREGKGVTVSISLPFSHQVSALATV